MTPIASELDIPFDTVLGHLLAYRASMVEAQLSAESWTDFMVYAGRSEAVGEVINRIAHDLKEDQQEKIYKVLHQHRDRMMAAQAAHETWCDYAARERKVS